MGAGDGAPATPRRLRAGFPVFPPDLMAQATTIVVDARARGLTLTTAESCTGGLVAAIITEIAGSSSVFERGLVTYSNAVKTELLGVPDAVLDEHGAVSAACAVAMADGALSRSGADMAVSVTGIAGPGGATPLKPVGLVHFALARRGFDTASVERRFGDAGRGAVRMASVAQALAMLADALRA